MATSSGLSYVRSLLRVLAAKPEPQGGQTPRPDRARDFPRLIFWLMVSFLAIGVLARLTRYAVMGAMWGDECMLALNIATRDWAGLTRLLDDMQTAPILFLWSERAMYLLFGTSELALRFLPLAAGVAALFVFWDFARRATSPLAAVIAVGILAVARWPVCMSGTLKPYASDLLVASLLMNLAYRWRSEPGKLWPLASLVLLIPIAMSGSYTAAFVAGGVAIYLLPVAWSHPDRRARVLFAAFGALMFGTFALNYQLHIQGQLEEQGRALEEFMLRYWQDGFPPADPLGFVKWAALIHTGRLFAYPIGDANGGSVLTFALFVVGVGVLWRMKQRALLVLCLVPFALNFVAAVLGKFPYGGCCRLSQHLAPAIVLIVGVACAWVIERFSRTERAWLRNVVGLGVVFAVIGVWQMGVDLASPNHDEVTAWSRQLHRELNRHLKPGDRVIMTSPRCYMDKTVEWQLIRLGDRLSWEIPADNAADAPRVWLLANVAVNFDYGPEVDALTRITPGRVEVGRAVYSVPTGHNLNIPWQFTMICLAKPEHAAEKPVFRRSP